MKSWIKKVIKGKNDDNNQQSYNRQTQKDKNKKIVVSFDKHQQLKKSSSQQIINKNNQNHRSLQHQTNNQIDYLNDNYFDNQKVDENDYQKIKQIANIIDTNKKRMNFYKKRNQAQFQRQNLNLNEYQQNSSAESQNSESKQDLQSTKSKVSPCEQYNLLKMTINLPDLKGQNITLQHLSKLLTNDFNQTVNEKQLIQYLLSKSIQGHNVYLKKVMAHNQQSKRNKIKQKLQKYRNQQKVQLKEIKKQSRIFKFYYTTFSNSLIFQYYPVRALIWKIVSAYLPSNKGKWVWKMEVSLLKYRQLVKEHIVETVIRKRKIPIKPLKSEQKTINQVHQNQDQPIRKKSSTIDPLTRLKQQGSGTKDHPLNLKQNSKWKTYFQDFDLWQMIERDTSRTRQSESFFRQKNLFSLTNEEPFDKSDQVLIELRNYQKISYKLNDLHLSKSKNKQTTYSDALTRIIFVFLKCNSLQKYYQGLNDFVAVIYYSFTNKNGQYFRRVSQSDTYEVFSSLMDNLSISPLNNPQHKKLPDFDHFKAGDKYFYLLKIMIRKYDFRLYQFLDKNNGFQYLKAIAIRWFMSLFLTQFTLDEALILWDSIMVLIGNRQSNTQCKRNYLKDLKLTQFLLYMALAVIHLNRNQIFIQADGNSQNMNQNINCSQILIKLQKIKQKPEQIISKSINLFKSFPNLLE